MYLLVMSDNRRNISVAKVDLNGDAEKMKAKQLYHLRRCLLFIHGML